jgi:hypothetical protein
VRVAPPYPHFLHVADKVLKAPDNSNHSSTVPSLNQIGPAGRLRACIPWDADAVEQARIRHTCLYISELARGRCSPADVTRPEMNYYQTISIHMRSISSHMAQGRSSDIQQGLMLVRGTNSRHSHADIPGSCLPQSSSATSSTPADAHCTSGLETVSSHKYNGHMYLCVHVSL